MGYISKVGEALGICQEATRSTMLVDLIKASTRQLLVNYQRDIHVTLMHEAHLKQDKEKLCGDVAADMRSDGECARWMDGNGSAASNTILETVLGKICREAKSKRKGKSKDEPLCTPLQKDERV